MKKLNIHPFFWVILAVAIIIAAIVLIPSPADNDQNAVKCVPSSCCHSTSCIPPGQAPDCSNIMCTQECVPGTLDCGQGSCAYVGGKCEAVLK